MTSKLFKHKLFVSLLNLTIGPTIMGHNTAGVNLIKLFSTFLIKEPNKLECLSLAGLSILILCLRIRAGAYPGKAFTTSYRTSGDEDYEH